jgi:glycine cleavage system regulatory protein
VLAERNVNIVDLDTRVIGEPGSPVYAMLLDVTIPPGTDPAALAAALESVAAELGIECAMHPAEADIL